MKYIASYLEFRTRVNLLTDHLDLAEIEPDRVSGVFLPSRAPELLEYCRLNPEFHIVSPLRDTAALINRIVPVPRSTTLAAAIPTRN